VVGPLQAQERRFATVLARIRNCRSTSSSYEIIENQAMSIAQTPGDRKPKHSSATIALAVLHVALVGLTLLLSVIYLLSSLDDPHEQCRYHGLHCDRGAHMREVILIGLVGSATAIILEFLTLLLLRKHRRLSVVVPILCCVGQFIILGAITLSDNSVPASG
jgi:hypothetical protein